MHILKKARLMGRHLWLDTEDAHRAVPPAVLDALAHRVRASEARHTGQVRICVEASLPMSYLWRLADHTSLPQLIRQRALMVFGKLKVWDTEHNNGVLLYLQLAERTIEIVADRGLSRQVGPEEWQAMTTRMAQAFREQRFEDGLTQALEEVSALLVAHFPRAADSAASHAPPNTQADAPLVL